MSAVPRKLLTPEEYLAREELAEFRSEYYRGEVFAVAGGAEPHNLIIGNILGETRAGLKGTHCRVYPSEQRIRVDPAGLYTYPDVSVVCGRSEFDPRSPTTIINPVALIEVLSPSNEGYDRGDKAEMYRRVPSLREHFLVAQDRPLVQRYVRQPDDSWNLTTVTDMAGAMAFTSVPVTIPLAEVYSGVTFPDRPAR